MLARIFMFSAAISFLICLIITWTISLITYTEYIGGKGPDDLLYRGKAEDKVKGELKARRHAAYWVSVFVALLCGAVVTFIAWLVYPRHLWNVWLLIGTAVGLASFWLFLLLARLYNPSGYSDSASYGKFLLTSRGTPGMYMGRATAREVYENGHGIGSWKRQVAGGRLAIFVLCSIGLGAGLFFLLHGWEAPVGFGLGYIICGSLVAVCKFYYGILRE